MVQMGYATRRVSLVEPGEVRVGRGEIGALPDDHVLVRAHQASICGTDLTLYRGRRPDASPLADHEFGPGEAAVTMGHEGGGEVVEVGRKVTDFEPGDFVYSIDWNHTMADYWSAPATGVKPRPDGLSRDLTSLGEPTACAVFAGMASGVELGDTVAISGMGYAGQIILQTVRAKGAARVIALDISEEKLRMAERRGADAAINPAKEDAVSRLLQETGGRGADVVIETSAAEDSFNVLSATLKTGGVYGIYSWPTRPLTLTLDRWHDDGFDVRMLALMHRRHDLAYWIERSLLPVAQGLVEVEGLITHRFPLDDAAPAFQTAANDPGAVKVVMYP